MMKRLIATFTIAFSVLLSCTDGILRGREEKSIDQKTYLVVVDDNGGGCGPIYVDGAIWNYAINEKGEIDAGEHTITCGGTIGFSIKKGTIFYFDYWGP